MNTLTTEPINPKVPYATDVRKAREHLREAQREFKAKPSYWTALKMQMLDRHWSALRLPRLA